MNFFIFCSLVIQIFKKLFILQVIFEMDEEAAASQDEKAGDNSAVIDQTSYIVIPSYASWFDYNAINMVEKNGIPEFFTGSNASKTPEM